MIMIFKKEKMIARLVKEGRAKEITPDAVAVMDLLDGEEATTHCWENVVMDRNVAYVPKHDLYVNVDDCI